MAQPGFGCMTDSECNDGGQNGRCLPGGRIAGCQCTYDTCFADADCHGGGPCDCRAGAGIAGPGFSATNICKGGDCRTDRDCGPGGYCSPTLGGCGAYGGVTDYRCHTPKDKCVDDSDCQAQGGGDCRYEPTSGAWTCQTSQCAG
jgi:hypothetical protein